MKSRLKTIRNNLNQTQKDFGASLGVNRNTYASYESGRVAPNDTFLRLLCSTYAVNYKWLTTGEGEMFVRTSQSAIDQLVAKYNLSAVERKMLEYYLSFDAKQRSIIEHYVTAFAKLLISDVPVSVLPARPSAQVATPSTRQSDDIEQQAQAFAELARQQFLLEKNTASSASSVSESDVG